MPRKRVVVSEPPFVDLLKPREVDAMLALGQLIVDGKTLKQSDFNKGRMSAKAIRDEITAYNDAVDVNADRVEAGNDPMPLPSTALLYQPVLVEAGMRYGGRFVYAGQQSSQTTAPKDWPTDIVGEWRVPVGKPDDEDYDEGSLGWKLGTGRKCHESDHRRNVVNRAENVLTVGMFEYVVGTKDVPALFLHNASKTGSYGAVTACGKRLSFADNPALANLVGQFNSKCEAITVDDGTVGARIVILPNMLVRWGYIAKGDKRLTNLQIRKAVETDGGKGLKFVALEAPIVGKGFTKSQLWQAVKRVMSLKGTIRDEEDGRTALERFEGRPPRSDKKTETPDKVWDNFKVICRTAFNGVFPFGVRAGTGQCPPVIFYGDKLTEEMGRFVCGVLTGHEFKENRWAAKERLAGDVDESAPTPAAKPAKPAKAAKAKAKAKAAKPAKPAKAAKAAKAKAAKPAKAAPAKAKAAPAKAKASPAPAQVDAPPVEETLPVISDVPIGDDIPDEVTTDAGIEVDVIPQSESDD